MKVDDYYIILTNKDRCNTVIEYVNVLHNFQRFVHHL